MKKKFEIGIHTLGERLDVGTNNFKSAEKRIKEVIEMAVIADEAGLDVFGIGEHHRPDFVTSSHTLLLAAVAQATSNIKITSGVSVIGTTDPVRLYEDFATIDLISGGRAELILGRGAFVESFGLFGYHLNDYDELFDEKLKLFLKIKEEEYVTWSGKFRTPLRDAGIFPRAKSDLPVWIGVGGTPQSAVRAGTLGLNMSLGILAGSADRIKPLTDLYWNSAKNAGHDLSKLRVSVSGHAYVAGTNEQAIEEYFPHYKRYADYFAKERGLSFDITKEGLAYQLAPSDVLALGNPETLAAKIIYQHKLYGHTRFSGQVDMGGQSLSNIRKAIYLLKDEVLPIVEELVNV